MRSTASLDWFDIKILAHLQREGRCSNIDLADAVGLTPSPCLARMKRLQKLGVIRGFDADIALEKVGDFVIVFSEVTICEHRRDEFRVFEDSISKHPEIIECYNVSGGYDYLLKIVTSSIALFQELMEKLLEAEIGIRKFSSRIVLRQPFGNRKFPIGMIAPAPDRNRE